MKELLNGGISLFFGAGGAVVILIGILKKFKLLGIGKMKDDQSLWFIIIGVILVVLGLVLHYVRPKER